MYIQVNQDKCPRAGGRCEICIARMLKNINRRPVCVTLKRAEYQSGITIELCKMSTCVQTEILPDEHFRVIRDGWISLPSIHQE